MKDTKGFKALNRLPLELRPRERLLTEGTGALNPAELLGLIIGSGFRNHTAVTLGEQIIGGFDNLSHFAAASAEELSAIPGIGPAKAAKVLAAIELGRRLAASQPLPRAGINDPQAAAQLFVASMRHLAVEHLRIAILDSKNRLIRQVDAAIGGLNISAIKPRDVWRHVLRANGAACILAHNHPSGDPTPSSQDIEMTRLMYAGASLLGIDLLDHIIVGDGSYVSLKQEEFF